MTDTPEDESSSPPVLAYADPIPGRWSTAAIVCAPLALVCLPLGGFLSEVLGMQQLGNVQFIFIESLGLASLCFAITTLVRIRRSHGRLKGGRWAIIGIVLSSLSMAGMLCAAPL